MKVADVLLRGNHKNIELYRKKKKKKKTKELRPDLMGDNNE